MQTDDRTNLRRELDEALLPFRLAKKSKGEVEGGWLLGVRQAIGIPVSDLAKRMCVSRWEVHRMERSEQDERIMVSTLRRAAEGLGCELVYGLVPKEGTLEELAAAQTAVRENAVEAKRRERVLAKKPFLELIDWRETWLKGLRAYLRREGYRMRPAKTDRNVANQMDALERNVRLLKLAGMLGPFVKKFMEEQEERESERKGESKGSQD